ncbi:MAG: hypothetical protein H0W89_00580 [Candidatus Levybacteria bacterium]|nr:hypothetical protein [Candidatus Levybacteria bacterium]
MITPFSSLLTIISPLGTSAQNDLIYMILPSIAIALGTICLASHITTRVVKKFI